MQGANQDPGNARPREGWQLSEPAAPTPSSARARSQLAEMRVFPAVWPDEVALPIGRRGNGPPGRRPLARVLRGSYVRPVARQKTPDPKDLDAVRAWVANSAGPTAIDLFSGGGGLSLGLHDAGFSVLVGADADAASVETHSANLGSLGYVGDLSDSRAFLKQMREWGIRRVDLLAGGVPCQPFSRAGRSKIRNLVGQGLRPTVDPRAGLWRPFMEIVRGLHPRAVLIENVPDLTAWNDGAVLAGICDSLADLGYRPDAMLLNAYDYGVPQHRSRLVIVATRPGVQYSWPEKTALHTVEDAIGDLPVAPPAQREEMLPYEGPATSWLQQRLRTGISDDQAGWIFDHITRDVRSDDAEAYALLTEGQTYADLPERLQRYRSDIFDDKYKRLSWKGLSRSITAHIAKDGYWYIHPDQDRTLSVREAARIQTFPDWFRFAGRPSERYRQIGNAVPPLLAEAVGRPLAEALARPTHLGRPQGSTVSFRRDLVQWHERNSRQLPWRDSANPWLVLVGEICLSRANTPEIRRVFPLLSDAIPTPAALLGLGEQANARLGDLTSPSAVRKLTDIARAIQADYEGSVPELPDQLRLLPHVGEWLVASVVAYGWQRPAVVLDGGCARVASRLRGKARQSHWQARIDLRRLAGKTGPDRAFGAAVADLGALVCVSGKPRCDVCPARRYCVTAAGEQLDRPLTQEADRIGRQASL